MKNRLTVIRAEKKISQETLAKLAGISRTTLSNIENEKVNPDVETVAKLVSALGVSAGEIFLALSVV